MRCSARNIQAEFSAMLGSMTWFSASWSQEQKHHQSRSFRASAETTERDPIAWHWYRGSRDAMPRLMWRLLTHRQHPTCRKMRYRQEVLQRPRLRERRPSTVRSPLHVFFPVAVVTLGPLSDDARSLIEESVEEPRAAQLIRGKLRSCNTNVFSWQFSVLMQFALATRSQFHQSPHRNHSWHTSLHLLILRSSEWSTRESNNRPNNNNKALYVLNSSANSLLKEIGYKISLNTGESRRAVSYTSEFQCSCNVSMPFCCTTLCRPLTTRTEYRTRNCLAVHNF